MLRVNLCNRNLQLWMTMARVLQYFLMFAGSSREAWKTDLLQWNKRPYGPNISLDEMAMERDGPNMFTPHKISPVNPWMIWVRDYRLMTFFKNHACHIWFNHQVGSCLLDGWLRQPIDLVLFFLKQPIDIVLILTKTCWFHACLVFSNVFNMISRRPWLRLFGNRNFPCPGWVCISDLHCSDSWRYCRPPSSPCFICGLPGTHVIIWLSDGYRMVIKHRNKKS